MYDTHSRSADRPVRRIVLATDLRTGARQLFADALGLALRAHAELVLLHIDDGTDPKATWRELPTVRELLERWGTLPPDASYDAFEKLGIRVRVMDRPASDGDVRAAIARRVAELAPDLVLLGTSARTGAERLVLGSVGESVARDVHLSTLLVPHHARSLVNPQTGTLTVRRVLLPVTAEVAQQPVIDELQRILGAVAPDAIAFTMVHVGTVATLPQLSLPTNNSWTWRTDTRTGNVVEELLDAALEHEADLVAMATRGHDSFLDTILGSVMERVLRRSPCPVLAVRV
jgi:nucleotide-binding universal stress UspA family protein